MGLYFNSQKSTCNLGKFTVETQYDGLCGDLLEHQVVDMVFPKSLKSLDSQIFNSDAMLETVVFEEGSKTKSIGNDVFNSCSNLREVQLPESLETLGERCFASCKGLTELTLPESMTSIGHNCFGDCENLQTITINKPMDSIPGAPWGIRTITVQWSDGVTPGIPFNTQPLVYNTETPLLPAYIYLYINPYLNEEGVPSAYQYLQLQSGANTMFLQGSMSFFIENQFDYIDEFQMKFHISDRTNEGYQFIKAFGNEMYYAPEYDTSNVFMFNLGFNGEQKVCEVLVGLPAGEGEFRTLVAFDQDKINYGWNTLSMKFDQEQNAWAVYLNDAEYAEPIYTDLPAQCEFLSFDDMVFNIEQGQNCVDINETGFKKNGEWVARAFE